MYVFESTVFLLPITAHFVPAVAAAYELGTIDAERATSVTATNKRLKITLLRLVIESRSIVRIQSRSPCENYYRLFQVTAGS